MKKTRIYLCAFKDHQAVILAKGRKEAAKLMVSNFMSATEREIMAEAKTVIVTRIRKSTPTPRILLLKTILKTIPE